MARHRCSRSTRAAACLLSAWLLAVEGAAQDVVYRLPGTWTKDQFGDSVAAAGDVNKDGFPDLVIGAPRDDDNGTDSGSATLISGHDGSVLRVVVGDLYLDRLGWVVAGAGDLDADGYADFMASANRGGTGYVRAYSGRTGATLYTWHGDAQGDFFGYSLAAAGDVDKDGFPDVMVGAQQEGVGPGYARVFSGKDGSVLFTLRGSTFNRFATSVAGAGDVNGDGHADLIVGAPGSGLSDVGRVVIFSGKDATILRDFTGDKLQVRYGLGQTVAGAGDLDLDGTPDVLACAKQPIEPGQEQGVVLALSGKTGALIHRLLGDASKDRFHLGWSLSGLGDFDRDGYPDLLVGRDISMQSVEIGEARIYSGRTGARLATLSGPTVGDAFGTAVASAGDVTQDGVDDFVVGAPSHDGAGEDAGLAVVYSGARLALKTDGHTLSLTAGGSQEMQIDVGPAAGGHVYVVLGSASGTRPGIPVFGHNLPLNLDVYHDFTLAQPNTLIQQSAGALNAGGKASAYFVLPKGWPAQLAGLRLHHAALVFRLAPFVVTTTTNAASLLLVR